MKKKITVIMAAVAVGALLVVGGTLAFFTDTETATNVVTTGNVNIELWENNSKITEKHPGETYGNIVPGATENKAITVQNSGLNKAYVRVTIQPEWEDKNTPISDTDKAAILNSMALEGTEWLKGTDFDKTGILYYTPVLDANKRTSEATKTVTFPAGWDNTYTGRKLNIKVVAEAVQSDNNAPATVDLAGYEGLFAETKIESFETAAAETTAANE